MGAGWRLFFLHVHYLVTDFLHLKPRTGVPCWYDLALILSCPRNGLLLAYALHLNMHTLVRQRLGIVVGWAFATGPRGLRVGFFEN
ncbi:DUF1361 domain-containing protein [Hymenobacter bucti]|uniref:DUF1361 domain-containing protein n=1 Tax=Hymenobacter bucti TaxID=1844114 RepID=A0ABW4R0E3_9BACT